MALFSSKKLALQLILIILLMIAIGLQVAMRSKSSTRALHHLSTRKEGGQHPQMLQDFFIASAEREAHKQEVKEIQDGLQQAVKAYNTSTNSNTAANATAIEIANISSLGCIDIVRKCMRYKAEKKPALGGKLNPSGNSALKNKHAHFSNETMAKRTVALAAPVLKGGYRNQYMRFVGLVSQALTADQNILLESVKWHEKSTHNAIPFAMLWNVDVWNAHPHLPKLIPFHITQHRQFNTKTTIFAGSCPSVIQWFQSPHRTSLLAENKEMTLPFAAGGARNGQPGNLWDYYRARDKYGLQIELGAIGSSSHTGKKESISLQTLEEWILSSMEPSVIVQSLVDSLKPKGNKYMALHPRIEPEMMDHRHCQADKIYNLNAILDMVTEYPDFDSTTYPELFVAVAMPQMMERQHSRNNLWYKDHIQNVQVLQTIFKEGLTKSRTDGNHHWHVWTAGESSLEDRNVNQCMLQLMASIVNMELAIQADVFIGTAISTWSTSVWKYRHYRGLPNYEFTKEGGIKKLEGLPAAFRC